MNDDELRALVLRVLEEAAPGVDVAGIDAGADFAEQVDIDSMDQLNFVIGLHEATGVDIPERDYPKMASLDACVEYLRTALPD
jgi:acyl carrier protein